MRAFLLLVSFSLSSACAAADAIGANSLATAAAILRWHAAQQHIAGRHEQLYVTVDGHDAPAGAFAELEKEGVEVRAGSLFDVSPSMPGVDSKWHVSIGAARPRPDGDVDVDWGYYCGPRCAASFTSTLHIEPAGWRIVASKRGFMS